MVYELTLTALSKLSLNRFWAFNCSPQIAATNVMQKTLSQRMQAHNFMTLFCVGEIRYFDFLLPAATKYATPKPFTCDEAF
jgi:hypothetical protein